MRTIAFLVLRETSSCYAIPMVTAMRTWCRQVAEDFQNESIGPIGYRELTVRPSLTRRKKIGSVVGRVEEEEIDHGEESSS